MLQAIILLCLTDLAAFDSGQPNSFINQKKKAYELKQKIPNNKKKCTS